MTLFIWILVAYTIVILVGRGRWRLFAALAGFSTVICFMGLDFLSTPKTGDFFTDGGGTILALLLIGVFGLGSLCFGSFAVAVALSGVEDGEYVPAVLASLPLGMLFLVAGLHLH
jgi:hypothetical protein